MARRKIKDGRSAQLNVRCTREDLASWRKAARQAGMKTSAWFRARAKSPASLDDAPRPEVPPGPTKPDLANILTWLGNFMARANSRGVETAELSQSIARQQQGETTRLAQVEAIRSCGNEFVHAVNLGADPATLHQLADRLLKLIVSYES